MKIKRNSLFIGCVLLIILIYLLIEPSSPVSLSDDLFEYEGIFIEPLFYVLLGIAGSTAVFFAVKSEIFNKWTKYILSWFLPLSFLVIASGTDGAHFGWMPKTTLAQIMGALLVVVTIGFVLAQALLPRLRKNKK